MIIIRIFLYPLRISLNMETVAGVDVQPKKVLTMPETTLSFAFEQGTRDCFYARSFSV